MSAMGFVVPFGNVVTLLPHLESHLSATPFCLPGCPCRRMLTLSCGSGSVHLLPSAASRDCCFLDCFFPHPPPELWEYDPLEGKLALK